MILIQKCQVRFLTHAVTVDDHFVLFKSKIEIRPGDPSKRKITLHCTLLGKERPYLFSFNHVQ